MTSLPGLIDSHGRIIRDLRVSITDRCNFRCMYCLPETEEAANFYRHRQLSAATGPLTPILREWQPRSEILSFEEIERVVRNAVALGVEKIRLTGGEPLLRKNVESLVGQLSQIQGVKDLAMTSNGFLFSKKAAALKAAGLGRISFSLDSLQKENFLKMTGRDGLQEVLEGIQLAKKIGFTPVKVNAVIIRGVNDNEIKDLAEFAMDQEISFRFIEFMPLDSGKAWQKEFVVPAREILARLQSHFEMTPIVSLNASETARRWQLPGGRAEIGIIAPVSEPFCGQCNRLRLTADGKIRTCLFSLVEPDLKPLLRNGGTDEQIQHFLRQVVWKKEAGHRINEPDFQQPQRSMSCIGG